MAQQLFLALCLLSLLSSAWSAISCLDERGKPVDSWVALKAANSWSYYYMSGTTWVKSAFGLSQGTQGMVMRTSQQAYGSGVMTGIYNDEVSGGGSVSSSHAHAKGILATDGKAAFWIVHSMPKWPATKSGPGPFDSNRYAQSLMCISVSAKTADTIASNLMVENVFLTTKTTASFSSTLPNFSKWLSGATDARTTAATAIKTLGGATFYQLSKSKAWGKDLWDDLVGPYFKTPLYAETWRNGVGGRFGSVCTSPAGPKKQTYNVYAVQSVKMPDGVTWQGTDDHSKWAVGAPGGASVACVGGINRMCSQEKRGGAALCSTDSKMHSAFSKIVAATESCWSYNPCSKGGKGECYWC